MNGTLRESTPKQIASPAPRNPRKTPYIIVSISLVENLGREKVSKTHSIIGRFLRRVRESAQEIEHYVLPQRPSNPIQNKKNQNWPEIRLSPVQALGRGVMPVVISDADDFPNPRADERDANHAES
jgi:hypothetical protein